VQDSAAGAILTRHGITVEDAERRTGTGAAGGGWNGTAAMVAVNKLVSERLMLESDAPGAIANATTWFTQAAKGMLP
jgi:hypothetical protein